MLTDLHLLKIVLKLMPGCVIFSNFMHVSCLLYVDWSTVTEDCSQTDDRLCHILQLYACKLSTVCWLIYSYWRLFSNWWQTVSRSPAYACKLSTVCWLIYSYWRLFSNWWQTVSRYPTYACKSALWDIHMTIRHKDFDSCVRKLFTK